MATTGDVYPEPYHMMTNCNCIYCKGRRAVDIVEAENKKLRAELHNLKIENRILKDMNIEKKYIPYPYHPITLDIIF